MKAFLASVAALIVIAVAAMLLQDTVSPSSADVYQSHTGSVRL